MTIGQADERLWDSALPAYLFTVCAHRGAGDHEEDAQPRAAGRVVHSRASAPASAPSKIPRLIQPSMRSPTIVASPPACITVEGPGGPLGGYGA